MSYQFVQFSQRADKTLDFIRGDVAQLRTGRASAQMLDIVSVEAYGTRMKVNELANISVPDPGMLVVTPWDKSLLPTIEKAIASSGLNLHPVVDGTIIRIVVPPLTEERRKELVKLLHQKIEAGRVMMRSVRTDAKKEIEDQEGQAGVSEDMIKADLETLEKKVKEYMEKIDALSADKEKELMTV
ncbi:ribosome recycling factor [Patescibacteria group bacterium]|nr:ribosome recycling factor [Patescibacteria group bacterium]